MTSSLFWGFGWKVASELGFDFLDGGQTAAQFLWEGFGELGVPGGDGDGLIQASQGILGDESVLFPTERSGSLAHGSHAIHGRRDRNVATPYCGHFAALRRVVFVESGAWGLSRARFTTS